MKRRWLAAMFGFAAGSLVAINAFAQGMFLNLGFESANVSPLPPGQGEFVFTTDAVPAWSVWRNSEPVTSGIHNDVGLTPQFSIFGPFYQPSSVILDGQFTVALLSGSVFGVSYGMSIGQTGFVPMNSQSLQFKAFGGLSSLDVSVNGSSLSLVPLTATPNYTLLAADISAFDNQTVDLRFTARASQFGALVYLDAIQFSGEPVPEPSTWALLALGSALFWCAARRRRK